MFKWSDGLLYKKKLNSSYKSESARVDSETVQEQTEENTSSSAVQGFSSNNIFSAEETVNGEN